MQSHLDQDSGNTIPVMLSCEGSLKKSGRMPGSPAKGPRLRAGHQGAIEIEGRGAPAKCEVRLNYRYRIAGPETQT